MSLFRARCGFEAGRLAMLWALLVSVGFSICPQAEGAIVGDGGAGLGSQVGPVLYIPIPDGMSKQDFLIGSKYGDDRLDAKLLGRVQAEVEGAERGSQTDRIVIWTDPTGAPILPDLEAARRGTVTKGSTDLTFSFDSPENPWTEEEITTFQAWIDDFYPVIKDVYGDPAFGITINIFQSPGLSYAGLYDVSQNQIVLPGLVGSDVLCHEIIHAFRDDNILAGSSFEEGTTRAAEVEVFNRLADHQHWDENHQYTYDVHYEALNQSVIGSAFGSFFNTSPNTFSLLRYQLAGYAWAKPLLENPSFLADFNAELFARTLGDDSTPRVESKVLDAAASVQAEVEGLPFLTWYGEQAVFDRNPSAGCFIYQRINQNTIDVFCRDAFGSETMQPDLEVQWAAFGHDGRSLGSGVGVTSSYGTFRFEPNIGGYSGRVSVEATTNVGGQTISSVVERETGFLAGLFGIVEEESFGTVTLEPLAGQMAARTVDVVNGRFHVPEMDQLRGPARAVFRAAGGSTSIHYFNKDLGRYFVKIPASTGTGGGGGDGGGGGGGDGGGSGCTGSTAACVDGPSVLCIDGQSGDRRFEVRVRYDSVLGGGLSGDAQVVPLDSLGISQGGVFYFFGRQNPEVLVKVLNGCAENGHFWVFGSAGTTLGMTIDVRDTRTGCAQSYNNPDLNRAAPISDTTAFATCDF